MGAPTNTTAAGSGTLADTVKTAYDRAALFAFRASNLFRAVASYKAVNQTHPSNVVTFTKISALANQTSALSETADPSHLTLADATVSITMQEDGATTKNTKKLKLSSFLDVDMVAAYEIARNMEDSLDVIARDVLVAGTNVFYSGNATSRVTVGTDDEIDAENVWRARAELASGNAPPPMGSTDYVGFIHPDVSYDLQIETGQQAWSAPHVYSDPENMYSGEIGRFGGVRFIETANAKVFANASNGSGTDGTIDVYATLFVGLQALGEAVGEAQHLVIAGPFDDLQRFVSIGWYAYLGFGRIREESIWRLESSSTIGANS